MSANNHTSDLREESVEISPSDQSMSRAPEGSPDGEGGRITAAPAADEMSQESEDLFRALAETVPAAILIVRGSRVVYANSYVLIRTGYTMDEILKMNFWDLVHPDFKDMAREYGLARQTDQAVPSRYELKVVNKNGEAGWFDSAATIMNYQGQPAMLITGFDVTGRRQTEEDLRTSEEKFSRSFNSNPNPMTLTSLKDGRYIDANESFLLTTGYSREEIIGRTSFDIGIWLDSKDRDRLLAVLSEQGVVRNQELSFRMKGGDVRVFLLSAETIEIRGEQCLLITTTDITDRKAAESALVESERRLQAMLDNSPTAIYLKDREGRYLLVNRYFENVFRISRARIIGKTDHDLLPRQFADRYRADDQKVLESGSPMEFEEIAPQSEGLRTYISIKFPLYDSDGRAYAVCGISTDITERKWAEEVLRRKAEQTIHHQKALIEIAQMDLSDLDRALRKICEVAAATLGVEWVRVWFFSDDRSEIACENIYQSSKKLHESGPRLNAFDYPRYFEAIADNRTIATSNACNDPRMSEISERLLKPFDISSAMDVPVWLRGKVVGVVCHGHVGEMRVWTQEEQDFAASMADTISLALEASQRKRAEDALRASEEKYRELVENLSDAIYMVAESGLITYVSRAVENISGYAPSELIDRNFIQLVHADDLPDALDFFQRSLSGSRETFECRVLTKSGDARWVRISGKAIRADGRISGVQGIITDITERKRAEEALRKSEVKYRSVVEQASEGMFLVDVDTKQVLESNPAFQNLLGYTQEEILNLTLYDIVAYDRETIDRNARLVGPNKNYFLGERQYRRKDKSIVYVDASASLLHTDRDVLCVVVRDVTERKRASEELQQSLSLLRATLESTADGILAMDLEGRMVGFNQKFVEMWNIPESISAASDNEQALLHGMSQLKDPEGFISKVRWLLSHPEQVSLDILEMKDGRVFERYSQPQQIDGKSVGRVSSFRDITERKRTEEALRQSEQRFRALAETAASAIIIYQGEKFCYVNQAAEALLGYSRQELLRMNFWDIAHPNFQEMVRRRGLARQRGEQVPMRFEVKIINRQGEERWLDYTAGKIEFEGESAVLGTAFDITERKRAEEALRRSEEKYRRFFEEDLSADYIATPSGSLIACNPAFAQMFGFASIDEARGCDLRSLYTSREAWEAFVARIRSEKKLVYHETGLFRRDGTRVNVVENVAGAFDDRGELVEIRGYLFDNTEHRRLEKQLLQSQKMEAVGMLAGGVAHDFNNLLTGILGYSQLILRRLPEIDPMRKEIEEIEKACVQAASLTNQLLAFSRQQVLQPRVIDLNDVINENARLLRRIIGEDIELVTILAPDLGCVRADPMQIQQVMLNLAVNARDAMPQGGKLTIETANLDLDEDYSRLHIEIRPGPHVLMRVSDTGLGMDEEVQSHIFDPFFTTKEKGRGTGLGLSTVYGIIRQSGGNISVHSEAGKGTSFRIYLSRVFEPLDVRPATSLGVKMPRGSETILIVEDSKIIRDLACETLRLCGYTVVEASGSGEALLMCEQYEGRIHLLVTDVVMPHMSGPELAERLARARTEMKVLYMSGYTDNEMARHGVQVSELSFLQKPFTPAVLSRKVREVLDN